MKIRSLWGVYAVTLALAVLAGGCGSSGSGSTAAPVTPPPPAATTIKGTASAGIIYPGTVSVYAVDQNGNRGAQLAGPRATTVDGTYTADLGSYSGAILIEASGTYTDEATGRSITIPDSKPLHAMVEAVDNGSGNNRTVSITPLTELAWRKASTNGTKPTTAATMVSANRLVNDLFKISDIIGIEPVRPDNASMAAAVQDVQAYTLALASLSKLAVGAAGTTDLEKLDKMLSDLEIETEAAETGEGMSAAAMANFTAALDAVALSADFRTVRDQLALVGRKARQLTLATSGTLPAGTKIYAIQGTITLPQGVSIRADNNGQILSSVFSATGVAAGAAGLDPVAQYLGPQQQVNFSIVFSPSGSGIDTGDFAVLTYDLTGSAAVTAADFAVAAGTALIKDATGADIPGMTLTLK